MESQAIERLSRQQIYIIRIHKFLARLLYAYDRVWTAAKLIFFTFSARWILFLLSKKRRAKVMEQAGKEWELQGDIKKAVSCYEMVLRKYPKFFDVHLNLCRCHLKLLSFDKAEKHGKIFLERGREVADGYLYMGLVMYYKGKKGEALDCLKRAEDLYPVPYRDKASVLIAKVKQKMPLPD